ncbi:MAG: hypothetical protein ACRC41_15770, partial [Sarcina sp.]
TSETSTPPLSHLDCNSILVIIPGNEVDEEHCIRWKSRQALHQDCVTRQRFFSCFLSKSCSQLGSNHLGQSVSNTGRERIMANHGRYQSIHLEGEQELWWGLNTPQFKSADTHRNKFYIFL